MIEEHMSKSHPMSRGYIFIYFWVIDKNEIWTHLMSVEFLKMLKYDS